MTMAQTQPIRMPLPEKIFSGQLLVGSTALQLNQNSWPIYCGITISTDAENPGTVYVGFENVLQSNGYALIPLASVYLEVQDQNRIWLISEAGTSNLIYFIGS